MTQLITVKDTDALIGAKELSKQLASLGKMLGGRLLRGAATKAIRPVVKKAKQLAPQGMQPHKTFKGRLVGPGFGARSVGFRTKMSRDKRTVFATVGVKPEAYYMVNFVELGVPALGIPARPWLRPAYEETYRGVISDLTKQLRLNVNKAIR